MHTNPKCVVVFLSNFSQDTKTGSRFALFRNCFDVVLWFTSYPPTGCSQNLRDISRRSWRPGFWSIWHIGAGFLSFWISVKEATGKH